MPASLNQRPDTVPVEKLRYRCSAEDRSRSRPPPSSTVSSRSSGRTAPSRRFSSGSPFTSTGYNILVQGLTGTGRETTVKSILEKVADKTTIPRDICYVHNFDDPDRPIVLYLPPGDGAQPAEADESARGVSRAAPCPPCSSPTSSRQRRTQLIDSEGEKGRSVIKEFEERIKKENFVLIEIRFGPMTKTEIAPIVDGKPRSG